MLATFRFHIAYNGSAFSGFQSQASCRTVEDELKRALFLITNQVVSLRVAGRTDAGVHASGQVLSVELFTKMSTRSLTLALFTKLPSDIAVWRIDKMPHGFDARRHSIGKHYIYRLSLGIVPNLSIRDRSWHMKTPVDLAAMQEALGFLVGENDFSSFRSVHCQAAHAIRYIWCAKLKTLPELIEVHIKGNAFCLNMVRIMVGTVVEVGRGRLQPEDIKAILKARDRRVAGITAKAQGLTLERIYYPDDLSDADIPSGATFPRFPINPESWPIASSEIEYGIT